MSKMINEILTKFGAETPTLQNQHNRISLIGFLPQQANTNFTKDKEGVTMFWAQLLVSFSSSYNRTDEQGESHDDNSTIKTLVVKFPMSYLKKYDINTAQFKNFFDQEFVQKKFIVLPVSEEKQSFQYVSDKRVPVKNQSEVIIHSDFDLLTFIQSFNTIAIAKEKR